MQAFGITMDGLLGRGQRAQEAGYTELPERDDFDGIETPQQRPPRSSQRKGNKSTGKQLWAILKKNQTLKKYVKMFM